MPRHRLVLASTTAILLACGSRSGFDDGFGGAVSTSGGVAGSSAGNGGTSGSGIGGSTAGASGSGIAGGVASGGTTIGGSGGTGDTGGFSGGSAGIGGSTGGGGTGGFGAIGGTGGSAATGGTGGATTGGTGGAIGGTGGSAATGGTGGSATGGTGGATTGGTGGATTGGTGGSATGGTGGSATGGTGGCVPTPEICDGFDNDCDGVVDEPGSIGCTTFFSDADGDGYGVAQSPQCLCAPSGLYRAQFAGDCNDQNAAVYPGAPEQCDGLDNNCNGVIDEGANVCPCNSGTFNGHAYLFCTNAMTWPSAQTYCAAHGYHLASIGDVLEDYFLYASANLYSTNRWWMGFDDRAVEGQWVWEDASPVTYTDWFAGEPNNLGNEDCGQINRFYPQIGWNDESCSNVLPFICESPGP